MTETIPCVLNVGELATPIDNFVDFTERLKTAVWYTNTVNTYGTDHPRNNLRPWQFGQHIWHKPEGLQIAKGQWIGETAAVRKLVSINIEGQEAEPMELVVSSVPSLINDGSIEVKLYRADSLMQPKGLVEIASIPRHRSKEADLVINNLVNGDSGIIPILADQAMLQPGTILEILEDLWKTMHPKQYEGFYGKAPR